MIPFAIGGLLFVGLIAVLVSSVYGWKMGIGMLALLLMIFAIAILSAKN